MKIVMLDQDGVVCDRQYQPTADISELIYELGQDGQIIIAPNTDTPVERIKRNYYQMIGLKPTVIVAERGAVVEINGRQDLVKNICGIREFIVEAEKVFRSMNCCVEIGDASSWIHEGKKFRPNSYTLIVDGLREQTIAMYFMKIGYDGLASVDPVFARHGLEVINSLVLPAGLDKPDYNEKYGIAICNATGVSKTDGYMLLRKQYSLAEFYMVGDSDSDIILDESVIHCAVANASAGLKEKASFIADRPITEGLAECLEWIRSQ